MKGEKVKIMALFPLKNVIFANTYMSHSSATPLLPA